MHHVMYIIRYITIYEGEELCEDEDKVIQDETREYKTTQDKTSQDNTRQPKTRQDKTRLMSTLCYMSEVGGSLLRRMSVGIESVINEYSSLCSHKDIDERRY